MIMHIMWHDVPGLQKFGPMKEMETQMDPS